MAWPFIFHSNYETGNNSEWTSESDTGSLLDIVHFADVAKDQNSLMPYKGAYVLRNLLGDTNDHTLTSSTIAITNGTTSYFRWYMGLSRDFRFTASNTFNVFELQQSGGTVEACVGLRLTNSTQRIDIGIGATAPTTFVSWPALKKWVCIELLATISTGGSGVLTLYVDGTQAQTLTGITHGGAIGKGVLGSQDTLATTLGAIYFHEFIMDDGRLFPYRDQFPFAKEILKTGHQFVGPGNIESGVLYTISGGDESLVFYDTDNGNVNDRTPVIELSSVCQTSAGGPIYFEKGCYAVLSGATPRGAIQVTRSNEKLGVKGPLFYSNAGMRLYGQIRKQRPGNV